MSDFDPDAFIADQPEAQEFDPDAFLSETTPAQPNVLPELDLSSQRQDANAPSSADGTGELLRWAMDEAHRTDQTAELTTLRLAEKLGVPSSTVRAALPDFERAAAAAEFDPERFAKEAPPELLRLIRRNPALAPTVLVEEKTGVLTDALRSLARTAWDLVASPTSAPLEFLGLGTADTQRHEGALQVTATQRRLEAQAQGLGDFSTGPGEPQTPEEARAKLMSPEWQAQLAQARAVLEKTSLPKTTQQVDDEAAAKARADGFTGLLAQRYQESSAGLEAARLRTQAMLAEARMELLGPDAARAGFLDTPESLVDLRTRIHDLELQAQPRFLGEGEYGQLAGSAVQGVASTLGGIPSAVGAVGMLGAAGAVVGAVAGARSGVGAAKGAQAGAGAAVSAKGGTAALMGFGYDAFLVETGSTSKELESVTTDAGNRLTKAEILGGSLVAGALKAGVEVLEVQAVAKTFGPLKAMLEAQGARGYVRELLAKDPRFRAVAAQAAGQWLKSAGVEGLEEGVQAAIDNGVSYLVKSVADGTLQVGPVLDREAGAEAIVGGTVAGLGLGAVGAGTRLVAAGAGVAAGAQSPGQVAQVLQLAQHPAAQAAPKDFAQAATEATASAGSPVTALHVDAAAAARYFQEASNGDPQAAARLMAESLGPDGAKKVAESLWTGGKVEVPLEDVLGRYGATEAAKALEQDTTTAPHLPTPREATQASAAVEEQAQAIARQAQEDGALETQTESFREQLIAAGRTRQEASVGAALVRSFMATQAADFETSVGKLFPELPITAAKGDETAAPGRMEQSPGPKPAPMEQLAQREVGLTVEQRAAELFVDPVSGLRNRRAWDESPRQPGAQVAIITTPDAKAINDRPDGGHDTTNELLRLIGGVIGSVDPEAARSGTNFLFHVKNQAQLLSAVARVRAALPRGLTAEGAMGATVDEAFTRLDAGTDAKRAAGALPARGQTAFTGALDATTFAAGRAATPALSPPLLERAAKTTGEAFVREAYLDPVVPGVLSRTGFEAAPEAAHVLAFDLKGLKRFNQLLGKQVGDWVIKSFGETAQSLGGEEVSFAHLSGDEYAAKHDDPMKLEAFRHRLEVALRDVVARHTLESGEIEEVRPAFRFGLGEKTYGNADRALNAAKRAEGQGTNDGGVRPGSREGPVASEGEVGGVGEGQAGLPAGAGAEVAPLFQDQPGAAPKGYAEVVKGTRRAVKVFFNASADVSTITHELAHGFLEVLRGLAERPDAPQRTRDTWAAAQAFLGHSSGSITTEQQEKWARSFEAYMMEGKAPSGALAKAFARAKLWMMDIYRAIRGVPGAALNDDARRVFDALLATEDELNAQVRRQGPPLHPDAKAAGVTAAEWAAQLESQREAYDEGNRRVQLQAIKDALRVHEGWWKAGLAQLEARFATEYEMLPGRVAQRLIDGTELGEPVVLDRDAVKAVIGDVRVPGLKTEVGGTRPGAVAELAGFPSGETMLAALAGLRPRERWVKEQAQAEMQRLHPGILDDITRMRREVADGLHAVTEKRLLDEWAALRREDPATGVAPVAAFKLAAKKMVDQRQAGKLRPAQALQLERRAATLKAKAAAKGDWTAAAKAAREQLLNAVLHAELTRAEGEVEKLETLAQRMGRAASRERLGKASPVYRDAVDYLLGAVGLGSPARGLDTSALRQAVAQMNGDAVVIGDPDWLEPVLRALAGGQPWSQWTMADVRQLRNALKMMSAAATQRSTVLVDDKRTDKEAVKADVIREVSEHLRVRKPLVEEHSRTLPERVVAFANGLDGFLLSPIDVVRDLVGDNQSSTTWRSVVLPLRRAEVQEADMLRTVLKPVLDAFEEMPKAMRRAWADPIDGAALFPGHIENWAPRRRYELIMMALNAGSETSLKALTEGRGISLEEVHRALGLLTAEEIAWVNGVLKQLETLREPAFALEERETGLRPHAVEAVPIQLPNGRLTGGYFPLKAIKEGSVAGERMAADEAASLFDPTYTRPTTAHGHLKSRTGAAYPVVLDPEVIRRHLIQVVHDITFREAVKSVASLVFDPEVKSALIKWAGPKKADQFVAWLKDIAGVNGVNPNPIMKLATFLKGNMATALLSGPSTAIGNLANLPTSVASTKLKTKHLAAALFELGRAPRDTRALALERSGILRQMSDNLAQDFERSLGSIRKGPMGKAVDISKDVGLWLMRNIDVGVSSAVWGGAFRQALAAGMEEKAAGRWADDILLQVQPSSSAVEKSGILRDRNMGAFVMFYGYLSVAYRAQHRLGARLITREFQEGGATQRGTVALKTAGALFGFWVAYQVVGELLMGRGPEDGDRDDEDPESEALKWRNWALRKVLVAPLAVLPMVPAASAVEGVLLKKPVSPRQDPISNLFTQVISKLGGSAVKYMNDEAEFSKVAIEALRTAGLLTGVPTRLIETTGQGAAGIITGDGQPIEGPGDAASRLIYGQKEKPPENVITWMAGALGL